MKIDFLVWNGSMYVKIQHDYLLDEIFVIKSGVAIKLQHKPQQKCATCLKVFTADTPEEAQKLAQACNHSA